APSTSFVGYTTSCLPDFIAGSSCFLGCSAVITASPSRAGVHLRSHHGPPPENGLMSSPPISAREAEVLALLGEHLSNAEIGARLFISVRTVESHVSSLLRKLQMADRRALAVFAVTEQSAAAQS